MTVKVRFAPSPTGYLHIGNARPALLNWLFALSHGGQFVLRIDDTDVERCRDEYRLAIGEDLAWLGITPHELHRQSERTALYDAAVETLKADGRLYPCYETADELERRRARQRARGLPPIYDRAALALSDAERAALEAAGRKPHWRFKLDGAPVSWTDLVRGEERVETTSLSDPILVREDGTYLYTLPSVVDDIEMGITHVIRGEDHVTNTGVQIAIIQALGGAVPVFAHANLLATTAGEAFSKRSGALSLLTLRRDGYEAMAVASIAVLTGTSDEVHAYRNLDELAAHVDLAHVSRSTAKFDPHELDALNARLVHKLDHATVADRLAALGIGGGEAFWLAVRDNLAKVVDAALWWRVVEGPIEPVVSAEDVDFLGAAKALLPEEPWDETTWGAWTKVVGAATGRKGRALFMPLRQALTGLDHGPELKRLLPLIGRRNTSARLP